MPKFPVPHIRALPATDEHWLVVIHHLRLWVAPPGEAPARPYGLFTFAIESGLLVSSDIIPELPTAAQVQAA